MIILLRYDEAVEARGKFHVAVSGGSLPKFLKGLSKRKDIDWTRWWIYFCDERYVSEDDADSNYLALKQHLLCEIPVSISADVTHRVNIACLCTVNK